MGKAENRPALRPELLQAFGEQLNCRQESRRSQITDRIAQYLPSVPLSEACGILELTFEWGHSPRSRIVPRR